jgi:hypothetical protein
MILEILIMNMLWSDPIRYVRLPDLEERQEIWLNKLVFQESSNRDNIKILDNNGKFSKSCLQFQDETFIRQGKKYDLLPQDLKINDVDKYIYNCELQKKIAMKMLKDNKEYHWRTSVKKIGYSFPLK